MLDLSSVVTDPRVAQTVPLYRKNGDWVNGRFVETETKADMTGTISIASAKQLEFIPEGDKVGGEIAIHTATPLYTSRNLKDNDGNSLSGTADQILWHDERYKIYAVKPYRDYGYYFAIGQRLGSD